METHIYPYRLQFRQPATTSRGTYHYHHIWFVLITNREHPTRFGIGECAPLPDLSPDFHPHYEQDIRIACDELMQHKQLNHDFLRTRPSIRFGLETARQQWTQQQGFSLWPTHFAHGTASLPINGLIWMSDRASMQAQITDKLAQGFDCIKLKIGGINFDDELALLASIRQLHPATRITLRVDANGAFSPSTVRQKLDQLAQFDLHSIEQPIRAGQWRQMADLIQCSPIPIALDEELIGIHDTEQKIALLTTLKPHYLVLKPSLHGGISGVQEWIALATQFAIPWWMTSALESNIGLNAIAQLTAMYNNTLPQGLGTGMLYHNNVPLPLRLCKGKLSFDPAQSPSLSTCLSTIATAG